MKYNKLIQFGIFILFGLFSSSCSSLGENFFIRNYEDKPLTITYSYYEGNIDSTGLVFQAQNFVLIADTLLKKKAIKQFPYKSHLYFDTLAVNEIDSLTYELQMPAKSTIRIAPIYYMNNVEFIVINNADTIRFVSEYPHIENEQLRDYGYIKYKPRIFGDSYYILNLKLIEVFRILHD